MNTGYDQYIKPELAVLIPVLYAVGAFLKSTKLPNWAIPFVLGGTGVVLATLYTLATATVTGWQQALLAVFTGISQGILCAAASVYFNQLVKQAINKNGSNSV